MKSLVCLFLLVILIFSSCNNPSPEPGVDPKMDAFVSGLMKKMTIEEKIGQLTLFTSDWSVTGATMRKDYADLIEKGEVGAILNAYTVDFVTKLQKQAVEKTRLGIPLLFGYDVIHGHRTIFPIPLAQASSWDLAAIERSDRIAAAEATAEGLNWTYSPMVDIARDPRWGRVMEGAGEDPYLGNLIAAARVTGFQGNDLSSDSTLLACVKHFAAYGAPQAGRDYNTVDMSLRSLYEWYLPPYRAAINAGAGSVMTSFNEIAGVPSSSNKWLLTDLLRNEWGFRGFIVSDYTSINELIPHGVAADGKQAAELAINAGLDMDMMGSLYLNHMKELIGSGSVTEETVNNAVRRVLEAKYKLGLFEDPYRYCNKKREASELMKKENLEFARKFASESLVLLKNDNNTLPVRNTIKTIALIGPLADSKRDMLGSWSAAGQWQKCVTLLEGIKNRPGDKVRVIYSKGCEVNSSSTDGFRAAVIAARQADFVILALGESADMSGEAASRANLELPGVQMELARKVLETGVPSAVVLFNGRPLVIEELDKIAPAILEAWFGGTEAGNGIADVLFGDVNPSGKLTMTFPRNMGQIPVFYSVKNTGRPVDPARPAEKYKSRYLDSPNSPLYPFGYGLSYTSFNYSDITLNKNDFQSNDTIIAQVEIENKGQMDGEEVAQLYIRDIVGDVTRPLKELKGFRKVLIKKGEKATVIFKITPSELSYYHQDMSFKSDPGDFELYIGTSSADSRMKKFRIL
jgi:beta-glucosidase